MLEWSVTHSECLGMSCVGSLDMGEQAGKFSAGFVLKLLSGFGPYARSGPRTRNFVGWLSPVWEGVGCNCVCVCL